MKRVLSAVILASLLCIGPKAQVNSSTKLGILPVFDSSGEAYGEVFVSNLTRMIYERFADAPFEVVLLNPGGLYNPLIGESITEVAQLAGVNTVLVTTFAQTDKPKKGDWILHAEAHLVDTASGKAAPSAEFTHGISNHQDLIDAARVVDQASGKNYVGRALSMQATLASSRAFEKQPLGKAALAFAEGIHTQILPQLPSSGAKATPQGKGSCTVQFHVQYVSKKAFSAAYSLILNGQDQSLWIKDGVATVEDVRSGPLLVLASVADAPYKVTVQSLYQANTFLDCARPEHDLYLDIGAAGEAFLHWR